ncbi:MAG: inner-rane translocator [Gemmatimonadetes bacterium]|nr:inner-rane translocator [Gemmatimonadota bacterium]
MAHSVELQPPASARRTGNWRRMVPGPAYAAIGALIVLVIVNALFTPNFASTSNLWNILLQVSTVVLAAVGMTLVIATGGIDLSVGSVMAIAGAVAAVMLDRGTFVALLAAAAAATLVGVLNGTLIATMRVQPIVVTLATLIAGRGLAQVISHDGELVTISSEAFAVLGRGHIGPVPVPVFVALLAVGAAVLLLRSTPFGRYVLAVGGNPAAARLAGVPVRRTLISVYAASGFLAGIAGLIVASRLGASDAAKIGQNMELDAIAAVVVGGTALSGGRATILGTVVGALIMQVIATSFNMLLVPYAWSLALKAAIILVAVYLQRPKRA